MIMDVFLLRCCLGMVKVVLVNRVLFDVEFCDWELVGGVILIIIGFIILGWDEVLLGWDKVLFIEFLLSDFILWCFFLVFDDFLIIRDDVIDFVLEFGV